MKAPRTKKNYSKIPDDEIVIGKIYATWCGHCKNMGNGFRQVGDVVLAKYSGTSRKSGGGRGKKIKLVEIEESVKDAQIAKLNNHYFGGAEKVKANGYPTVFMISGGDVRYYNGNTNFTDPESGEKNKQEFQSWIESNISSTKQRGGGCGCGASGLFSQRGGWRWSTKKRPTLTKKNTKSRRTKQTHTKRSNPIF